ncbi:MAG: putative membrane-anchored protein [Myxococcota bacterium]|jgi:uncharacterized membrane-anchored protein
MLTIALVFAAFAQDPTPSVDAVSPEIATRRAEVAEWLSELPPDEARSVAESMVANDAALPRQTGTVSVADGAVELQPTDGMAYLDPASAGSVLEAWGNPPGIPTLGMITSGWVHGPDTWAVVLQYEQDGWVDDSDAASIDYAALLASMQADEEAGNAQRAELGLATLHLQEWAEPPRYDSASKVLYWAQHLSTSEGADTLNYEVRVLGRTGVLSLNAVAGMHQLPTVRQAMEPVREAARFTEGNRYVDYDPSSDRAAGYGLAALVAGGAIASKTGLFKGLFVALLAGKKFVVIGLIALAAEPAGNAVEGRR